MDAAAIALALAEEQAFAGRAVAEADELGRDQILIAEAMAIYCQGTNGDAVYSNERALMGHIQAAYYLRIPFNTNATCAAAPPLAVDVLEFGRLAGPEAFMGAAAASYREANRYINYHTDARTGEQVTWDVIRMALLNYHPLVNAGMSPDEAYYVATLRARWMVTGALNALLHDNSNTLVEHIVVPAGDPVFGNLSAAGSFADLNAESRVMLLEFAQIARMKATESAWVVKSAEAIWASVEYMFRARGHHFKSGGKDGAIYEAAYTKFLNASFEGDFTWPDNLSMAAVFHTAIHPFKIRALVVCTAHYLAHGMLSQAAKVRLTASPCGHAIITTCVAALNAMKGEIWWTAFEHHFHDALAKIGAFAEEVNNNRYAYHQASGLYSVPKATHVLDVVSGLNITIEKAKNEVKFIAAACQGLVQALHSAKDSKHITGFSLENSRALEPAARDVPLLTERICTMIETSIELAGTAKSVSALIEMALPNVIPIARETPID